MNVQRLEMLAAMLDNHKDETIQFDLETWGDVDVKRSGFLWLKRAECHTTACAVGLACLSGVFKAHGLTYEIEFDGIVPVYLGTSGILAAAKFFGVSEPEAGHLFYANRYDGPIRGPEAAKAVAARIRALIAAHRTTEKLKERHTTPA